MLLEIAQRFLFTSRSSTMVPALAKDGINTLRDDVVASTTIWPLVQAKGISPDL
jgi:hypothetical protein